MKSVSGPVDNDRRHVTAGGYKKLAELLWGHLLAGLMRWEGFSDDIAEEGTYLKEKERGGPKVRTEISRRFSRLEPLRKH